MPWKLVYTRVVVYLVGLLVGVIIGALSSIGLELEPDAVTGLETFLSGAIGGGLGLLIVWAGSKLPWFRQE